MQYGVDLTHLLILEIKRLAESNGATFVAMTHRTDTVSPEPFRSDEVHLLNGLYYRTSPAQYEKNLSDINQGLTFVPIPVTLAAWRVGPDNAHLNEHATDQVMMDLSKGVEYLVFAK
jgi:hypothetical protein